MRKDKTTSTFNKGLIMDLNPLTTPNNVMTDALNATIITYNGNEHALQNDMGNGRVETAYLPEGYIPLGTTELGGIIYIVSYNPQIDKCQIGCFPSPERNFTSDELGISDVELKGKDFVDYTNQEDPIIINQLVKKQLTSFVVHPGDRFKIAGKSIADNSGCLIPVNVTSSEADNSLGNIRLRLGTLDSNGQIIELDDSNLLKYTYNGKEFIIQDGKLSSDLDTGIDEYRKLVNADYNIYQSKISGELYLIAKLAVIDSFDVTYSVTNIQESKYTFTFYFNTTNDYYEFGNVKLSGIDTIITPSYEGLTQGIIGIDSLTVNQVQDGEYNYSMQLTYDTSKSSEHTVTYTFTPVLSAGKYPLFTTNISINLDLIGTGTIQSTIWKYYKNLNQMNLYFNLEIYPLDTETYEDLTIYFFKYNDLPTKTNESYGAQDYQDKSKIKHSYTIAKRKSYSGSYTEEVSFENIERDSLYLVVFEFKISETDGSTKYKHLYRCLYTNGVFNQQYVNTDSETLDFDTIPLNFDWTIDYSNNLKQIALNPSISREPPITSNTQLQYIRGEQKYMGSWQVELNPKLGITNDYNTFTVSQEGITITSNILDTTHVREGELINSSDTNIDSQFVQLMYSDENDPSHEFQTTSNSSVKTSINEENVYTIYGAFYIPISATSTLKSCTAQELFKPAISTLEELESTYGFTIANNHFSCSNIYPGLGMSNGGSDNDGGGGLYVVYGSATYVSIDEAPAAASSIFGKSGIKVGNWGFPDRGFSDLINGMRPFPIVPIHLRWAGCSTLETLEGNTRAFATWNLGNGEDKRRGWFELGDKYHDSKVVLWTFMKDNNESSINYYALNLFLTTVSNDTRLRSDLWESHIGNYPGFIENWTAIDVLVSVLMSTFVKVSGSDQQFEVYTVNEFSYYEDVTENITSNVEFTVEIGSSATIVDEETRVSKEDYILFNNMKLSTIYDKFAASFKEFKCLTFIPYNIENSITVNINNKITLTNTLVSQYLKYYQSNPILDKYIINIFNNIGSIELKEPLSTSYNTYFISQMDSTIPNFPENDASVGKIVLTHYSGSGTTCFVKCDDNSYDTFRFNIYPMDYYSRISQEDPSQLLNYITYSPRYNQILLDKTKMANCPSTYVYFKCDNYDRSDSEKTTFNNLSIGNIFTVNNGLPA